jgi:hypothetical protein
MTGEIRRALDLLFEPGQVVEVRAISEEGTASGYFDDFDDLEKAAGSLDVLSDVHGIYVTLNEVNRALLSRRANRVKTRLSRKDATTTDADIVRRRWFPVDVDPVRPSGVSSTGDEQEAAVEKAREIGDWLTSQGWPAGVLAHSGNGAHLLYRVDLPNDDQSRELVKRGLEVLAAMFDDKKSTVDTANHNAARIWKLYGTMSRKGDNTADRPHRRSRILEAPEEVEVVPAALLARLAGCLPSLPGPGNGSDGFDLGCWLHDHGIGVSHEKPYQGGTLYVLDQCPFSGEHRDGAFAIRFPNGAVHAGCHHASCGGGTQRWQELREKFEAGPRRPRPPGPPVPAEEGRGRSLPPAGKKGGKERGPSFPERSKGKERGSFSPPPSRDDIPMIDEALSILSSGDPKRTMLQTFFLDHEGDEVVAECLILSLASRSVANTNGLHVSVSGESGKGKSTAFSTLLQQVPERFRLKDWMSNKALFYIDGLRPGSVIMIDDKSLSDDMQEILKGVTSSFREPFIYRTVSTDRKGMVCTIPERCVWWVAKVEGSGDDQVFNRMLTCWIDDTPEQDDRCVTRSLHRDAELPLDQGDERPEILVCRAMWEEVDSQRFHVVIPFAPRIRFQSHANRRNPEMLLDLIKANAVLRFAQREQVMSGRIRCLVATMEDFEEAARLYRLLNGTAGGQTTKLTKREASLLEVIAEKNWPEFTTTMLQKESGMSNSTIHKCIHGYSSRGSTYSGLLEKCPAISFTDRTVVNEEERGVYMRRRTHAYTFDLDQYRHWSAGGGVWIDHERSSKGPDGGGDADGCPSAPSADFRTSSAPAEIQENESKGSIQQIKSTDTHMCVRDLVPFRKRGLTQNPVEASGDESRSLCDPRPAEGQIVNAENTAPIDEPGKGRTPISLQHLQKPAEICGNVTASAEIHARDYKPLDVPEQTPCFICGRSLSWFVEKLTPERKARPKSEQNARRLCRHCFKAAKTRDQGACRMLPGTVEVSRMKPVTVFIGKCSLCELDNAVYRDPSTGVMLCEACYQRAKRSPEYGEATG